MDAPAPVPSPVPSARQTELLDAAYAYVLDHGIAEVSLRPLAAAIGSSPRVLLYLFGSKDGLVRALLTKAREDELGMLREDGIVSGDGLAVAVRRTWAWLKAPEHRALLVIWVESYARSLADPHGAWSGFARLTVEDWLALLAAAQPATERDTEAGRGRRTLALALLRGALLDLLATGEEERVSAAVELQLGALG
jgi:AcrR family transcriptional regulator